MNVISGKPRDLGDGFHVARILPQAARRSVGPFVFFDYFGPVEFAPSRGIDVRPHPHIGLATVTYLFEGAITHRDTLGSHAEIRPGDVNWMTAGRGVVHSERTGAATRAAGHRLRGIQSWIGLPESDEEAAPDFQHVSAGDLPERRDGGVHLRLITGAAFGLQSPVKVFSPIFYADAKFDAGATFALTAEHDERAVFVVEGEVEIGGAIHGIGEMILPGVDARATVTAAKPARAMLLGGAPLGPRHLWWNFVSSSQARIERAKADWKAGRFGTIPGDESEFIPLPD